MKHFKTLIIAIFSLTVLACGEKKETKTEVTIAKSDVVEVIDFHSTHRCYTCKSIESNTKLTLETYFAKELEEGKITLQIVDVDLEENYKLAEKFEATGTALFINVVKDGKEEKIDLTEFAFENGTDSEAFTKLFKTKVTEQLNKL